MNDVCTLDAEAVQPTETGPDLNQKMAKVVMTLSTNGSTAPGHALSITIAMLTYRRAHLLPAALDALSDACSTVRHCELLIVDNDPEASAERVVRDFAADRAHPSVRYVHEAQPGISAARNRALDEAHNEILVFIDDDEVPSQDWLTTLIGTYVASRPTAVAGPVRHEFEIEPDPWIESGGFFIRRREHSGARIGEAASNNLLLDLPKVKAMGTRFDDRLGLTGGSDSLFTKQLVKAGGTIVWCDAAEVIDQVPRSRISRRWVMHRAFRLGNTQPRVDLMLAEIAWTRVVTRGRYAARGLVRLVAGGLRGCWGLALRNQKHHARGVRTAIRGAGMLTGAFGYVYAEYARKSLAAASAPTAPASTSGPIRTPDSALPQVDAGRSIDV